MCETSTPRGLRHIQVTEAGPSMLINILLTPIIALANLHRVITEHRDRAHQAWLAERAAFLEAGWEWDGDA